MAQVDENVKKVASLKEKIRQAKLGGADSSFLERQKQNLEIQLKQDALDGQRRNKGKFF